jgi:hypothetical protein
MVSGDAADLPPACIRKVPPFLGSARMVYAPTSDMLKPCARNLSTDRVRRTQRGATFACPLLEAARTGLRGDARRIASRWRRCRELP